MSSSSQILEREASAQVAPSDEKAIFSTALSASPPRLGRRLIALTGSVILHALVITLMAVWPAPLQQQSRVSPAKHTYSVRFLQLAPIQEYRKRVPASEKTGAIAKSGDGQFQFQPRLAMRAAAPASGGSESKPSPETPLREHRRFELPPTAHVDPVKQTLVQMDLPPNIVMKQEIPLPTVILWTETIAAPPMRKPFVAPQIKEIPKAVQHLPKAPVLQRPNLETNVAELNMASTVFSDTPHLQQPPGIAPPVAHAGQEPAKEIPKLRVADSSQPSAANIVSLPINPTQTSNLLVLPPVNQIAPSDTGSSGVSTAAGVGTEASNSGVGSEGRSLNASSAGSSTGYNRGTGTAPAATTGGNGSAASSGPGIQPGSGNTGGGSGERATGTGSAGSAGSGPGTIGTTGVPADMAGITRITLPKDGKFGVVVLGSAGSTPYPESVGALSGKVVYTVYMKVGLRKSWILQYCLPAATHQNVVNGTSSAGLAAPWPFLIMRPDQLADSDTDYIIVHGILNAAGQFDQLAMVFPAELDKKNLLLNSLKLWAFRPASRDGVPVAVEVLLIIPSERS